MPLRIRLTLLYVVLLAVTLAAFGFAVYVLVAKRLYDGVDETLGVRSYSIQQDLDAASGALTPEEIERHRAQLEGEVVFNSVFLFLDPERRILYSTFEPSGRQLAPPSTQRDPRQQRYFTGRVRDQRFRFLYDPLLNGAELRGALVVGQPLRQTDAALDELRIVFLLGGIAVLLLTSGLAYWAAGRALNPVRQVSRLAREIERTSDFSRRLQEPRFGGETRELVSTFNAMIRRVQRTILAQRAFLADSSHELRRPLTVLRTNVDVLGDPALSPEEREACLQEMRTEAETMTRLLADLVLLSREGAQAVRSAPVDYTSLCDAVAARLRAQDGRHTVRTDLAEGVRIYGDEERLTQMLWNVLENAAQYAPEGGDIDLRLQRVDGTARIEVSNTGVGIDPKDLPRIFERFYRGEAARTARPDGTGLGLAIVKYLAEAHGGTVSAASKPGERTTFTIDLPVARSLAR